FISLGMALERDRLDHRPSPWWRRALAALGEVVMYGPLRDQLGLSRIRNAYTGGEALGEDTFVFFRAIGVNLKQIYGQTESSALYTAHRNGRIKLHTVGEPLPGVEMRILDTGEIAVRSPALFDGYLRNPEATAESMTDGWFRTGDAGYFDEDGHLVVLGRVQEVARTASGERYVPNYIENRLKFSPYIKDAAVVGAGREYLAAIVCIDLEATGHWAEVHGIPYTSYADLSQKPQVYDLVAQEIARVNRVLPEGLRLRRFVNLHKEFDPDDGEITRTRKLRRWVIEERYQRVIDALYDGSPSVDVQAVVQYETGETAAIRRTLVVREVE
ncbi:MAG: AMP-binding protein, partial [Clostridia bacterium]|nr:AMP-binding protein [Clostridia bacterium]